MKSARWATPPLQYASGGNGSQHHLTMERLKGRAGIALAHVPYKGGAPATTATVSGEVAAMMSGTSTAPQIKAGRLRVLAYTGPKRSSLLPEVPTIAETYPDFEMTQRSEEHTSELQSPCNLVCRLLLEKKKTTK